MIGAARVEGDDMRVLKCALCGGEPWRNYDRTVETSLYCCDPRVRTGRCPTERDAEKKWNEIQRRLRKEVKVAP